VDHLCRAFWNAKQGMRPSKMKDRQGKDGIGMPSSDAATSVFFLFFAVEITKMLLVDNRPVTACVQDDWLSMVSQSLFFEKFNTTYKAPKVISICF
jgi:hypothetical protein